MARRSRPSRTAAAAGSTGGLDFRASALRHVEIAEFRAWFPPAAARVRAVLALLPGFNGDARAEVESPIWRRFARRHGLGLIGARFVSAAEPVEPRRTYCSAADGSGAALLAAVRALAARGRHPEAGAAPLLLWGHSAGGQFNYELACRRPRRVLAFVVNKGGYYATHVAPPAARLVPGIMFTGERDEDWRVRSVDGIYHCNRRLGALWTLAREPGVGHEVGGSRDLALRFFAAVLRRRLPSGAAAPIAMPTAGGWLGDDASGDIWPEAAAPRRQLVWLPDGRLAAAWSALVRGAAVHRVPRRASSAARARRARPGRR